MKKFVYLLFALTLVQTAIAQSDRPTVAVVLSGGGAKGVAHISALRAIEQVGIPIDIICGTSMGSLIGGLYCIGYTCDELDSLVLSQAWDELLSDHTDPAQLLLRQREEQNTYMIIRGLSRHPDQQGGLIRGRNLNKLFTKLCADYLDSMSFDSLPIRFACVATDLVTNNEVDFRSGRLIQAMRSSMAIPGVFTPVRIGDSVLVDGGLRNNYPADLAKSMGADIIIGVTVQGDDLGPDDLTNAAAVLGQIIDINCKNKYLDNIEMSDVVMRVNVEGYSAASFYHNAIDTLLQRGAEAALQHRDELLAIKASLAQVTPKPRQSVHPRINDDHPLPISRTPIIAAGVHFDSEETGALQVAIKWPLPTTLPLEVGAHFRLGNLRRIHTEATVFPRWATSPSVEYTFIDNNLDIYTEGQRSFNVKYRRHQAAIVPLNIRLRHLDVKMQVQYNHFNFYGPLLSSRAANFEVEDMDMFAYRMAVNLNTEDNWYFPTAGIRLHVEYAYLTNNLITYNDELGLSEISAHWRINISAAERLTFQPMFYGRILPHASTPLAYGNCIGGEWFGNHVEQQMPFAGIAHFEYIGQNFIAMQLQTRYRLLRNHYVGVQVAAGIESDYLSDFAAGPNLWGAQVGYSYNTLFGPIDLRVGWSNRTSKLGFMFNIGHRF
ncbi:MAG: patatin-like phospholipase family protein [Bacteroidales bacterium]|nr:patatin-like phospholipase family protein [Bacteroidales bacterium]MBR1850693.1 patatin-like phospholipase family protein [Bacteroidales bacterium]